MSGVREEENRSLLERLRDNYRLVVIDDHDLKEVNTFKFNLMTLYILLSTLMVGIAILAVSLIIFTPIKRFIPGYGDTKDNSAYIELKRKVEGLEETIKAQEVYIGGLSNFMNGVASDSIVLDESEEGSVEEAVDENDAPKQVTSVITSDVLEAKKTNELSQLMFATPISGEISAAFNPDIEHFGVDIIAPKNTAIKAVMGGVVINADWSVNDGNSVMIQHARNVVTVYKHNSSLLVKNGEIIKAGQAIAIIGNTGKLTNGPHLHLELWYNGTPVNPVNYISFN
jgi:murein DD-endopeptidase MepM/ murein hydrolase activator NlpD